MDDQTREKIARVRANAVKLNLFLPIVFFKWKHLRNVVRDDQGNIISADVIAESEEISRSWMRNAFNHLISKSGGKYPSDAGSFGDSFLSYKGMAGNIRSSNTFVFVQDGGSADGVNVETLKGYYRAANLSTNQGMKVGTGVGAEDFDSFALGGLISHGVGAGQLVYSACTLVKSLVGNVYKATWSRDFTHNRAAGPNVSVGEAGMFMYLIYASTPSYDTFMFLRDIVTPGPIDMAFGDVLTMAYEITETYP